MIRFYIEPGYNVRHPEREYGNAGVDFRIPEYTEVFEKAFNEKNEPNNAMLEKHADDWFIIIPAHGRANIPSAYAAELVPISH